MWIEYMLYTHLQHHNDTLIKTDAGSDEVHEVINDARRIKTQEDLFNNILYLSLYCKGSKGLFKVCVWEGAGGRT